LNTSGLKLSALSASGSGTAESHTNADLRKIISGYNRN
jgi:hypothetical protein